MYVSFSSPLSLNLQTDLFLRSLLRSLSAGRFECHPQQLTLVFLLTLVLQTYYTCPVVTCVCGGCAALKTNCRQPKDRADEIYLTTFHSRGLRNPQTDASEHQQHVVGSE